jgi:hypothetical protein
VHFTIYYYGDRIKEDEICGGYSTHGTDEKYIPKIQSQNLKGRYHSEDLGVDGKILERILDKLGEKV